MSAATHLQQNRVCRVERLFTFEFTVQTASESQGWGKGGGGSDSCVIKIHHLLRSIFSANVLISCLQFFFFLVYCDRRACAAALVIHYITGACELGAVEVGRGVV